jgi:tetratricopeptide (TPR) repeat protein
LGAAYIEDGNTAKGESALQSALDRKPDSVEPLALLVSMDLRRKQPDRAIARINAQIQKAPQAGGLYELLGTFYDSQKNASKAEEAFRKQASLEGSRAAGSMNLAKLYRSQKSFDAAIAELQNVISENPGSGEAHTILGLIYQDRNDSKKAIESYRAALKNDPGQAVSANNLAFLLTETGGDLKEAEQLAQQARKQLPDSAGVADTLAWVYYNRGAYRSAIELLRDCVKQEPKNAVYFYHLGMAYSKNGDSALAKEALTQALSLNPNMPQASEIKSVLQKL